MSKAVFLAGASGAVGRRLAPLLVSEGWRVVGTTRSADKAAVLRSLGVEPVIVDVFEASALAAAIAKARPEVVVHQLTDLPPGLDPALMAEATARNPRIRDEGTRNLVDAAVRSGVRRLVAQSVAFAYAGAKLSIAKMIRWPWMPRAAPACPHAGSPAWSARCWRRRSSASCSATGGSMDREPDSTP